MALDSKLLKSYDIKLVRISQFSNVTTKQEYAITIENTINECGKHKILSIKR